MNTSDSTTYSMIHLLDKLEMASPVVKQYIIRKRKTQRPYHSFEPMFWASGKDTISETRSQISQDLVTPG
jgi:hypothetical protein